LLRAKPAFCRSAVNGAIRLGSLIRSFSHTTIDNFEFFDVSIPKGA